MFGFKDPGAVIRTTAGKLTILDGPMIGGEGAGYKAKLHGKVVFYKEFNQNAAADLDPQQTQEHRRLRTDWLVKARLDQLDPRINAPFAMTTDQATPPGYICAWVDGLETLENWRTRAHPYGERLQVIGQIAYLLSLLHSHQIAQGDMNSANIGILGNGPNLTVILFDFGNYNNGNPKLRPLMAGEAEHMAFWLRLGKAIPDMRSDVYALGIMAYELLLARPVTAGCSSVDEMLIRLEQGRLPGDPMLGTNTGMEVGLPYQMLPPRLQTQLRNMIAPEPGYTPSVHDFLRQFREELDNLIECGSCRSPYFWTIQRAACPTCHAPSPAAIAVRLPNGGELPVRRNLIFGRDMLGGAPYLSGEHLILQPHSLGKVHGYIRGTNGMQLVRMNGSRLSLPKGSGPILIEVGDRLEIESTRLEFINA